MRLKRVDPKTIMVPEVRVTARFDEEKMAMFKESIKTTGQVAPIICVMVDGQFVLVDGLHRLQESLANKVAAIDVVVKDGDMVDVLTQNIFVDHLRGKTPVSEMRQVIEALYKEYSIGIEDIVKRTGLSQEYVEKLLNISELTPMCLEALDEERIGIGIAGELVKIKDPVGQEVALSYILANHWKLPQVRDYVRQVLEAIKSKVEPPPAPPSQPPPGVKCGFCGEEHTPNELASILCCHSCQGIMYESIALARRDAQQAAAAAQTQGDSVKHAALPEQKPPGSYQ